jgi:hypothetical protein
MRPSPENEKLYRPVDRRDPDVKALAKSIRRIGVKEPLVVSADGWLLSGHRRHVAAQLAGLIEVPCRIDPIRRDTDPDGFLRLLREFNRQRVKSFDEVVREEVLSADPEEAYRALLKERAERAQVNPSITTIDAGVTKTRSRITPAKRPLLDAIDKVLADRREYWPLSDRQIHYALLNDPPLIHASKRGSRYRNDGQSYKALTDILTRARLAGKIPWGAIADPTRPVTLWQVYEGPAGFMREQFNRFLTGYCRDLMRSQPNHVEIVVEKNTVEGIVRRVAGDYCLPLISCRGFCSSPPRYEMAERFRKSGKERLIVLLLSDHDPDGEEIASSFTRSLRDDFGLPQVTAIKVALTAEQVKQFDLPPRMTAKKTSSNYSKFAARHGDNAYELEALNPADLQKLLREAIGGIIDRDLLDREIAAEKVDAAELETTRRRVQSMLAGLTL